jgi:hypothetical protein
MMRQAKSGEFRSNLHRGGSATVVKITPEERSTAVRAAKIVGLNVAGVDILRSKHGPVVMEVNSSPGLEGIETSTKIDVSSMIIEFLEKNARQGKKQNPRERLSALEDNISNQQNEGQGAQILKHDDVFDLGGTEVLAGERKTIELPVTRLYTRTQLHMPVQVARGRKAGPVLFVSAAIHGDEINGVEIIRRLLKLKELKKLRGALIAAPVVNVIGFINHSRYLADRRDLNRCFPGSPTGPLADILAHIFMKEIAAKATHGIDIHTGAIHRNNVPQTRVHYSWGAGL